MRIQNGDGDAGDLVIQVFDVRTAALTVIGTTSDEESDPFQSPEKPSACAP